MLSSLPMHRIALPTPWRATGPVYVYLIRLDPVTIIDTGLHTSDSREALLAGLREVGVDLRDIRRVLLTHAHLDHHGQAAWIQEEAGAEVWLHPDEGMKLEAPDWWLAGREQALTEAGVPMEIQQIMDQHWRTGRQIALPLTGWKPLADGQRFAFDREVELEAVHLPGHALGHTGFWDAKLGVLIGGDHLLEGITPNPIMEPVQPGHPAAVAHAPYRALTLGQFLCALDRAKALPARQVLPGHGPVITDHRGVAEGYRSRHERRLESLWQRISAEPRTAFAITREIYPRVREFDVFLALSEVLAHLDLMVSRGRAVTEPGPEGNLYRTCT